MSLTAHLVHESAIVRIRIVDCRPDDHCCGPEERALASTLALPLRGVFVKHHGARQQVVADVCHGVFFNAGEPYRVSHPVAGGDRCLAIEPAEELLREIVAECGADGDHRGFGHTHAPLSAGLIASRKSLQHRLAAGLAGPLEADETALQLLTATTHAASSHVDVPSGERRRTEARHREIVDATRIALVAQPAARWTLAVLARRVYSSPFHLARAFRRYAGISLHRYQMLARMAAALDEVLDTSRDLAAIGVDLGFAHHSHFTAAFRTSFGVTPSVLRRSANLREAGELRKILTAHAA
jgi:AraC family transcriptional regulator